MNGSGVQFDQSKVKIEVEEDREEVSNVRSCYIWFSENAQSNLLQENTPGKKRVSRKRRKCAMFGCNNYAYSKKSNSEERMFPFHKFPSDETTRAIWIELCGRTDKFSAKSSFICSSHFKPEDYLRYSRLKTGAIPSRNLPMFKVKPVGEVNGDMQEVNQEDKPTPLRNFVHEGEYSFSDEELEKEITQKSLLNGLNKKVKKESCSEEGSGEVNDEDCSTTIAITSSDENEKRDCLDEPNTERNLIDKSDRRSILTQKMNKALRKRDQLVAANLAKLDEGPKHYPNVSMWLKSLVAVKEDEEPEIKKTAASVNKSSKKKNRFIDRSDSEELSCQTLNSSSKAITIVSSEDEDCVDKGYKIDDERHSPIQNKDLKTLKDKIRTLENDFEELKIKTNEEIERLKIIIKDKEEEFNTELREVLSVFLNPEQVESVISQTNW